MNSLIVKNRGKPANLLIKSAILSTCVLLGSGVAASETTNDSGRSSQDGYGTITVGFGRANATVAPNSEDEFYEGSGLSISFGLGAEKPLSEWFALSVRGDMFNLFDFSTLGNADSSWAGILSTGVVLGNARQPGQLFLSGSLGFGFASLSDQGLDEDGNSICIFCTTREGGSSFGAAGRLSVGYSSMDRTRIELVFMRVGGDGKDSDYPNGTDTFLDSFSIQLTGHFN